jgi:putative Holliday junction resolvase
VTRVSSSAAGRTLLAFDYGTQRIGVAIGNTLTATARPLTVISARSADDAVGRAIDLIDAWRPDGIVVGRPLGGEGAGEAVPNTRRAEKFARRLQGRSRLPVALVDERYSTFEARGRLRDDRDAGRLIVDPADGDDSYAAVVILEQYLGECTSAAAQAAGGATDGGGVVAT